MKYLFVTFIWIYQVTFSPLLHAVTGNSSGCRYAPVCSTYAKIVIMKYGARKGGIMALQRILSCHPFAKLQVNKV